MLTLRICNDELKLTVETTFKRSLAASLHRFALLSFPFAIQQPTLLPFCLAPTLINAQLPLIDFFEYLNNNSTSLTDHLSLIPRMRIQNLFTGAAFAGAAAAQFVFPDASASLQVNKAIQIQWNKTGLQAPLSINLVPADAAIRQDVVLKQIAGMDILLDDWMHHSKRADCRCAQ